MSRSPFETDDIVVARLRTTDVDHVRFGRRLIRHECGKSAAVRYATTRSTDSRGQTVRITLQKTQGGIIVQRQC